ncbi:proteoglycan 4-like isoform X1 [Argiope bruennichi]|uniref:Apical junction component 1 like protein n=1 Tax=Argiope bruennichi TaxID=94029 RepID=A0A8T0EK50_ARGBR|nr:proteoglycan 4-like isoform X1 [Argiope bruennichi]KAF8773106.1 Apical junction component 1 like protein [Argiope bruennichi]
MIRPSSTSAFTPVPSSSNSGFHQTTSTNEDDDGSQSASFNLNQKRHSLVEYDSEPKAYPRNTWRHSSGSSKDISPDNSSTDNELWLSVTEEMGPHKVFRTTPEHLDARSSSRSSVSPPSPPARFPQQQKRVSLDSTGSPRPIFFASSRRGSKGSSADKSDSSTYLHQPTQTTLTDMPQQAPREEVVSRKSSSAYSEESGFIRRDSRSGGSSSWRDSKTDSSSATTSRGEKDSKSSASLEEVLESLLAIPPTSSRSSSPSSPRRSKGPGFYQSQQRHGRFPQEIPQRRESIEQGIESMTRSTGGQPQPAFLTPSSPGTAEDGTDQGKMFADSLSFPQPFPSSSTSAKPFPSPLEEVNPASFCRSSSTSPLEDDVQSPTSMEVLVPEGEEQELSSIIEDEPKITEEFYQNEEEHQLQYHLQHHEEKLHEPLHECEHARLQHENPPRPPLQRQSTLPSCSSADLLAQQPQEDVSAANLFAGLQPGTYSRGVSELRRPQSLCLVLLHLPCMFCARALAPPPTTNSFNNGPTRMTCVSEPSTPVRVCCDDRVSLESDSPLTNLGSNPGRGASNQQESATPTRKKKTPKGVSGVGSDVIATTEGHLKCHRPKCSKSLPVEEARAKFRTCPNCYTYYCSRQCRKLHLARHKDHCPQTRISNLCKQVLMKARDDPVSRRHLSLCAKRGLLSRGRGAVKLLFLCPEDALDYLVHGWESAKGQTLYVSKADLLPQEMGSDVFSQVRSFCEKYNPERKFILLAAITVTNEVAAALEREVVVRGAKMHLSPSLPEDDVQTLILTITKTNPETGDPAETTVEDRKNGLGIVVEQLTARGVDLEKQYPHTYRKILKFVNENEPFSPISIFPTDQRNGRIFMCIILPWADPDIIVNISSKVGASIGKFSKKKWMS